MDLDSLTIGDARKLAALFGGASAVSTITAIEPLHAHLIGRMCIVRSSGSGVWYGRLTGKDGQTCRLDNARRVWSWTGAASCSGLALTGPTGGKITAPIDGAIVENALEVLPATDAAGVAFAAVPHWTAR